MLLLTAQFEEAIEFLNRSSFLRTHSIHMALALAEAGLLATVVPLQAPLCKFICTKLKMEVILHFISVSLDDNEPSPSKRLNLPRLILTYCIKFNSTNLEEAINYFYFLRFACFYDALLLNITKNPGYESSKNSIDMCGKSDRRENNQFYFFRSY
jgi:hypothetical protein